jgi:hypothetical protein
VDVAAAVTTDREESLFRKVVGSTIVEKAVDRVAVMVVVANAPRAVPVGFEGTMYTGGPARFPLMNTTRTAAYLVTCQE